MPGIPQALCRLQSDLLADLKFHIAHGTDSHSVLGEHHHRIARLVDIEGRGLIHRGKATHVLSEEHRGVLALGHLGADALVADLHPVLPQQIRQGNLPVLRQIQL